MGRVVVDSTGWSLIFRRRRDAQLTVPELLVREEIERLAFDGEVVLLGAVRQEVLTGIREVARFRRLRRDLGAIDDEPVEQRDYERAAEMSNACRSVGIQGSPTDFLICAVSERLAGSILTADADFSRFQPTLKIVLHEIA